MGISDALVIATCDKCGATEEVMLTALAGHNEYDMRNVKSTLEDYGWRVDDDMDGCICETCVEDEEDDVA